MKNATQHTKKLTDLVKKLPPADPPQLPDHDDPVAVLVLSFLMWESTTDKALAAYGKLMEQIVDHNDLRVCMPTEIVEYIGARYPLAVDRAQRLRAALRNIYLREHEVSLVSLQTAGKREVKKYVESLEGMTPYVAARVMLLCFDTHAIPVDEQLREQLIDAGAGDEEADVAEVAGWLSRQIKAKDGLAVHCALQRWVDENASKSRGRRRKTTRKKTTGKSGGKKSAAAN